MQCADAGKSSRSTGTVAQHRVKPFNRRARLERGGLADQKVYRATMQNTHDADHQSVGLSCGFPRHGPRQQRLNTMQQKPRKDEAKRSAQTARRMWVGSGNR